MLQVIKTSSALHLRYMQVIFFFQCPHKIFPKNPVWFLCFLIVIRKHVLFIPSTWCRLRIWTNNVELEVNFLAGPRQHLMPVFLCNRKSAKTQFLFLAGSQQHQQGEQPHGNCDLNPLEQTSDDKSTKGDLPPALRPAQLCSRVRQRRRGGSAKKSGEAGQWQWDRELDVAREL